MIHWFMYPAIFLLGLWLGYSLKRPYATYINWDHEDL